MNTSGTDPWEMGPIIAAGTAVAIDTAQEPEPERRPPAEPEPEPGPGLEPDARCVDDAGSEGRANTAVDPWGDRPAAIGLESGGGMISRPMLRHRNRSTLSVPWEAGRSRRHDRPHAGRRSGMPPWPVREWRRMATTAGGILLAACVTVAGMSAWRSHESATAARELEQATADCATARAAAKKAERKLAEYLDGDRLAQAKAVTADKLADPETLETLDKLAEQYSEGEANPACAATDTETANATTSKLQAIEKKHTGNLSRLKKAAGRRGVLLTAGPYRRTGRTIVFLLRRQGAGRIFSRPAARLHRQARREGHHRRHGQGERLHRREDQGRRGKESAGGGRSGCGGAGAEHAGTANSTRTRPPAPLRARVPARRAADTIPPAVPPARPGGSASPGWSVPGEPGPLATAPAPTRAYERTNTMPQLDHVDPVVRGTRHRPRVAGGARTAVPDAPRSAIRTPDRFADAGPRAAGEPGSLHALAHHPVRHGHGARPRIVARAARRPVGRDCSAHRSCWARPSPTPCPVCPGLWWRRASNCPSAVRVWRLPHIKGLELDGFPRRYPAAYSRLVKDVDAMPRATAHVG